MTHRLAGFLILCAVIEVSWGVSDTSANEVGSTQTIDLSGQWRVTLGPAEIPRPPKTPDISVQLDPLNQPPSETTDSSKKWLPVQLPGTLRDSGLGEKVGPQTRWIGSSRQVALAAPKYARFRTNENFKRPFGWQPERRFVGAAWYRRKILIPGEWKQQRIRLKLERPHWRTQVWVDGKAAGKMDSLSTQHLYDLSKLATPGTHTLTIGVDNGTSYLDVGINAHSVSDHTQTAWHGIVGEISLSVVPVISVEDVQVHPNMDTGAIGVHTRIANDSARTANVSLHLGVEQNGSSLGHSKVSLEVPPGGLNFETDIVLAHAALPWNEFTPNMCELIATLRCDADEAPPHKYRRAFGARKISADGKRILLNGEPIFLRGTLECCVFPNTGYPHTDVESWKRIIRICKLHGLNHIRFHSWCPPEAAFIAADELGFYFQVECSTWASHSTQLDTGYRIDQWLSEEAKRIVEAYANHPSFLVLSSGNEASGPNHGAEYLAEWVKRLREDGRFLVVSSAGWPSVNESDFHIVSAPRIHQWGDNVRSRINSLPPNTTANYESVVRASSRPLVGHEIGQWCVFPNFNEIEKYQGSLRIKNFEVFSELLSDAGMLDQANDFLMASGKLQALAYKEEIESSLRTPGLAGFQMLDLRDFPGQGTALVGILDPFWDPKPYINSNEFASFCGPIVPLLSFPKRVWYSDEVFESKLELSHFGPSDLVNPAVNWTVTDSITGQVVDEGQMARQLVAKGGLRSLGKIKVPLQSVSVPAKFRIEISVDSPTTTSKRSIKNDWEIWVYDRDDRAPKAQSKSRDSDPLVVRHLSSKSTQHLQAGGNVLLIADNRSVDSDVTTGMSPIFWNTTWTNQQAPHTLGLLCDPSHPIFNSFPTDTHSNWQWWELFRNAGAMDLSRLDSAVKPLVQLVPDWVAPRQLATIFECRVGKGNMLICSMDIHSNLRERPVARQLRKSILQYMQSNAFAPKSELRLEDLRRLIADRPFVPQNAKIHSSTPHAMDYQPMRAIDGDETTFWHSSWKPKPLSHPHHLTLDLGRAQSLAGIRYTPRQDSPNGRIAQYAVEISVDAQTWTPVAEGNFPNSKVSQTIRFTEPHSAQYVRLVAKNEIYGRRITSIADLDVVLTELPQE